MCQKEWEFLLCNYERNKYNWGKFFVALIQNAKTTATYHNTAHRPNGMHIENTRRNATDGRKPTTAEYEYAYI